jgi:hypothetical protein
MDSYKEEQISTTRQSLMTKWVSHQVLQKLWFINISESIKRCIKRDSHQSKRLKIDGTCMKSNRKRLKRKRAKKVATNLKSLECQHLLHKVLKVKRLKQLLWLKNLR